jgi:hypothetical protein
MKPGMDVLAHSLRTSIRDIGFALIMQRQNETSAP